MANKITIEQIKAALKNNNPRWQPEATPFFNLPEEEKQKRLGYIPGLNEPSLLEREKLAATNYLQLLASSGAERTLSLAPRFDLRNVNGNNYITPIKDQSSCGSCVSFGALATMEGTLRYINKDPNLSIDYSEAHLFYCNGGTCDGWSVNPALDSLKNVGVVDESCYPYKPGNQACGVCNDWKNKVTKISSWHAITNVNDMKKWISTRGPLVACFTVYQDFDAYPNSGKDVYHHVTGDFRGGHCVSIVGYDDTRQCWIAKNSWGELWGKNGFFNIGYGECGIDAAMWAIEGVSKTPIGINSFKAYSHWRGYGVVKLNLPMAGIHATSKVFVSISEYLTDSRIDRFVGAARLSINNVSPYEGGVTVWAEINWGSPINIAFDMLVYN